MIKKFALFATARATSQTDVDVSVLQKSRLQLALDVSASSVCVRVVADRAYIAAVRAIKKTGNQAVHTLRIMYQMKKRARNQAISSPKLYLFHT